MRDLHGIYKIYNKNKVRRFSCLMAILLAILTVLAGRMSVAASKLSENGISRKHSASVTVTVNQDEWYVDGATFRIYKVAELKDDLSFSFTDAFRDCDVDIQPVSLAGEEQQTASKWMSAASDLIQYVRDHNIKEDASAEISERKVSFSGLSLGLYLVQGDTAREGNRTVTYQPVLICVPQRNSAAESWKYDIVSQVKSAVPRHDSNPNPTPTPETTPTPTPENTPTPTPETTPTPTPETTPTPTPGTTPTLTPTPGTTPGPTPGAIPSPTPGTSEKTGLFGVKTGDASGVAGYLAIAAVAAAVLFVLLRMRKRHNQ